MMDRCRKLLKVAKKLRSASATLFPMPTPDLGPFLHAIADPARRRILQALKDKSAGGKDLGLNAGDIEGRVKLSQPTVSHHMRILEKAGLVVVKKQGTWRWYRRNQKLISQMTRGLKNQL
jgi:ArsR family transcriptional regulator, arsenate/arsenite/antimonite-responsive transcriptional repressor